jgi:hypothetical protein
MDDEKEIREKREKREKEIRDKDKQDEEKLNKEQEKRDKEIRDKEKREKEKRDKDKQDEENYIKSIQWPKTDEEWINFDFKKIKPGTAMPFKKPPRHQIEPKVPRNADGTIIMIDTKTQIEEQQKMIDALMDHVGTLTKQVNILTQKK